MDILKILFVVLILLFPLGEIARFQLGNGIAIRAFDILVGLVVITWIINIFLKKRQKQICNYSITNPIFIFVGICILSLLVGSLNLKPFEIFASASYLVRFVFYACIYFVVASFNNAFKRRITNFMIVAGGIIVFLGYVQYFLYPNLRNLYYLGWDEHMYRMFSTFLDPNFAGAFFVLYLVFLLGILLDLYESKKRKFMFLLGITSLFTLLSIYLTYSRSALIMLFVSLVTFFILVKKIKWILGIIFISLIFLVLSSKSFYIENINLFRIVSTEARIYSAKTAIRIIKDNPFLGVGFNTYRYAQIKYGFINDINYSHADAGTDNSFLFILATTGVVGFVAYLYIWWSVLKFAWNSKAIVIIASVIGLFAGSIFINSLFYPFFMAWMWVLIGLREKR